jgi:hypothetical protein
MEIEALKTRSRDQLWIVWHEYETEEACEETKLIGVFCTRRAARNAVARLKDKPGFCDFPRGFSVSKVFLDRVEWQDGFVRIY